MQFPHRQRPQSIVTKHPHVELTPVDILLGDRGGTDPLVDEGDALLKLFVGVYDGRLRNTIRGVLAQALDDQRQRESLRAPDLAMHGEYRESRHPDAMVMHKR